MWWWLKLLELKKNSDTKSQPLLQPKPENVNPVKNPEIKVMGKTNQAGIDLVKSFEGCKLKAYKCPADIWTIGYGHTGSDVYSGLVISQEQAEELLRRDLERFENGVTSLVVVGLTDNEFAALVSFSYNVGLGNLAKSTLLKLLNTANKALASAEFPKWNKAGGVVLPGLVKRREAERLLFLKP